MAGGLKSHNQEVFVNELVKGKSQREAYRIAYSKCKANDNSVDVKASNLFKMDKVRIRYEELRNRVITELEEDTVLTAKEVMKEISDIARDRLSNYLDFYPEKDGIKISIKDSRMIDTKNISEISIGKDGQFKLKTYCRDTALYKLAEIYGLKEDKEDKPIQITFVKASDRNGK